MSKIRALSAGISNGRYKVAFTDKAGRKGNVTMKVTDAVDMEYTWYDFCSYHGFPVNGVCSLEKIGD